MREMREVPTRKQPGSRRRRPERRLGGTARGYNYKWHQARLVFLASNPLCVSCEAQGRTEPADVVDHVKPHKGCQKLFWNRKNWQAMCKRCHNRKTAREDGGFGNPPGQKHF